MANEDNGNTFQELLPSLRAQYAFLECGRYIMKEVFIWLHGRDEGAPCEDIENVEVFLLQPQPQGIGWSNAEYRRNFNQDTRATLNCSGIRKIDITALWRLFFTVKQFFRVPTADFTEVEVLLTRIKNERNAILHSYLLKVPIRNQEQLEEYFIEVRNLIEDVIEAFDRQYAGTTTEQQKSGVRDFVNRTINSAREGVIDDSAGPINIEDACMILWDQVQNVAGQTTNLNILNLGLGDLNVHVQGITNVINQNLGHGNFISNVFNYNN